jgi:hypothetical protein
VNRPIRESCPACGDSSRDLQITSLIAPWLKELAEVPLSNCQYVICQGCKSGYANVLFLKDEFYKIYSDYRGKEYLQIRHKWEPSYSQILNESLDRGDLLFKARRAELERILDQLNSNFRQNVRVVVDVGGGHGSFIPDWPSIERRIVIDVSSSDTKRGIEKYSDWSYFREPQEIQLVMNCMVLEHLNAPKEFLIRLREDFLSYCSIPEKTLFYFEVPQGIPLRSKLTSKKWLLSLASKHSFFWSLLDKLVVRKPESWPLRIAEHIQFFTGEGMCRLLQSSGFEPILVTDFEINQALEGSAGIRFSSTLAVVAKLK